MKKKQQREPNGGYITIPRQSFHPEEGCPLWNERRSLSPWEAWVDLIQLAAWAETERTVGTSVFTLQRGEVFASVRWLARRWGWSKDRVHRLRLRLLAMGKISRQSCAGKCDIYIIENYDLFQSGATMLRQQPRQSPKTGRDKLEEVREEEECRELARSRADALSAPSPALLEFDCVGKPPTWGLSSEDLESLSTAFPNLDAMAECRRARAWLISNPGRRKTARGMMRFLFRWLSRATDSGGGRRGPEPSEYPYKEFT